MYQNLIRDEFNEAIQVLQSFLRDEHHIHAIEKAAKIIATTFKAGGKVFSCGNGGSHCEAMHFAEELTGHYRDNRPGYPAIVISDPSYFSCVCNDFGYEQVFSRYIEAVGNEKDVLVAISTSGKSANILRAIETAHIKNMTVIMLTGKQCKNIVSSDDIEINVPHFGYADRIQEIHIKIVHILILLIEKQMVLPT